MNKQEFLQQQTRDVIEIFEKHGSYSPTFAVLFDDGHVNSIATSFNGLDSKKGFDFCMRKICENPKIIASVFTCEVWTSNLAKKENKHPSGCADRETAIIVLYSTRDNVQKMHLYKPDRNGKLELIDVWNNIQGRFSNPFSPVSI